VWARTPSLNGSRLAPRQPRWAFISLSPLERTYPVQEPPVALEQAQRAVQKVEEAEGAISILPLVCQSLDQALLFVDIPSRSSNVLIGFGKAFAFANHVKAEQVCGWLASANAPRWRPRSGATSVVVPASRCQRSTLSSTISARNLPCSAVMRPTVMGRRKRRGPALPGLKKSVPFFVSILGWCE
jgi:hypothetical protein